MDGDEIESLATHQLGRTPSPEEMADFMKSWDVDKDGRISLFEYIRGLLGEGWRLDGRQLTAPEALDFSSLSTQCTPVEGAHNRGISLAQLKKVRDFVTSHADGQGLLSWVDLSPPKYSAIAGHRIQLNALNLYQVGCCSFILLHLLFHLSS